jgi:hypothetical protein
LIDPNQDCNHPITKLLNYPILSQRKNLGLERFPQVHRDSSLPDRAARYILGPSVFLATMAKLFEPPRYIALEGPIRVGKNTLANVIADRLNAQRVLEPEDNPFLRAFYEGQRGAGFQAQFAIRSRPRSPSSLGTSKPK